MEPLAKLFTSVVFIHRSIKTRIETPTLAQIKQCRHKVFIHRSIKTRIETRKLSLCTRKSASFLYIDPLKQGLKPSVMGVKSVAEQVFIHRSIKTRIETCELTSDINIQDGFLYIDPLKQGLKHLYADKHKKCPKCFYT